MENGVHLEEWATRSHESPRTSSTLNGGDDTTNDSSMFPFVAQTASTLDARMARGAQPEYLTVNQEVPSVENLNRNLKELSLELEKMNAHATPSLLQLMDERQQKEKKRLPKLQNLVSRVVFEALPTDDGRTTPKRRLHSSTSGCSERQCSKKSQVASLFGDRSPTTTANIEATSEVQRVGSPIREDGDALRNLLAFGKNKQVTTRTRGGRIRVVVRKRPPLPEDVSGDCVTVNAPNVHLAVRRQRVDLTDYEDVNDFVFDDAFDESMQNIDIFDACGRELLTTTLEGGSASCFAYGQTGSGKTHTMIGNAQERGLYILVAAELFRCMSAEHTVYVSLYEIYCNSLFDLLNNRAPVVVREDHNRRVKICGLTWHNVATEDALWSLINSGTEIRSTGSTSANELSSRSHAVVTIQVRRSDDALFCGTLNFVDLAGSERAVDTAACDRQTRQEGAEINKSLLALKECIRALDEKKKHVPFRGSKLTEILRDSFCGNSRTVMIANISASSQNYEHTVNTLRYAFRVKGLSVVSHLPNKARNVPRPIKQSAIYTPRPKNLVEPVMMDAFGLRTPRNTSAVAVGKRGHSVPVVGKSYTKSRGTAAEETLPVGIKDLRECLCALARAKLLEVLAQEKSERTCEETAFSGGVALVDHVPGDAVESTRMMELEKQIVTQLKHEIGNEVARVLVKRDRLVRRLRSENVMLRALNGELEKKLAECMNSAEHEGPRSS